MTTITVRNIPDIVMKQIKILSTSERRSVNNEILILLEESLMLRINYPQKTHADLSKEAQLAVWEDLCGQWEDNRSTKAIIKDIVSRRTTGRKVEL